MTTVQMYSGAWCGDQLISLTFPEDWEIHVAGESPGPGLDHSAIAEKIRNPYGSEGLTELARNARSAAIIIDDISRPTPTAEILPPVLDELVAGGLSLENVTIVIAAGGHEAASLEDNIKKLGADTAKRVSWELHDPDAELTAAGRSPSDIPLFINKTVMSADLKIGIGGIMPHDAAGFSGGSKILVPGVAGTQTARYLHDFLKGAKQRGGSIDNEFRRELDIITGRLGLNFIVNVILNHAREIADVFAGDRVVAHRQAVNAAAEKFCVDPPGNADIVVANTYPFDGNLWFVPWGTWPLMDTASTVSRVAIADGSQGAGSHRLKPTELSLVGRAWVRFKTLRPRHVIKQSRHLITSLTRTQSRKMLDFSMLCPNISEEDFSRRFPAAELYRDWESLVADLQQKHRGQSVKVVVYPCAPLQFSEPL